MIHQLQPEAYEKVRPLFKALDFNLIIAAVIEGTSPGRIFVDNLNQPRSAFIDSPEGQFLVGNDQTPAFNDALRALLIQEDWHELYLFIHPDTWKTQLPSLFGAEPQLTHRQHYLCTNLQLDWQSSLPEGYTIHRITRELLEQPGLQVPEHIFGWIEANWGTLDNFEQRGFGVCTVHANEVVSWSIADCVSGDQCEIGIHTAPAYRQRGLAALTAAAAVDHAFSRSLTTVGWHCNADNVGSWKTAQKGGFQKERDYIQYYCIMELAMQQPELGDTSVLTALFHHNIWANLKLLEFCEGLNDEQLGTSVPGTFGTIRDTLLHIVGAEVSYVHRVNGKLPGEPLSRDQFPGFEVLKHSAHWAGEELLQLALSARADTIVMPQRPPRSAQYPLASLMVQAINHSTEHRTQISTILTQLGLEPPDMTGWQYMDETGEFQETAITMGDES